MWWANDADAQYESNLDEFVTSSSIVNVVGEKMRVVQLNSAIALHRCDSCNIHDMSSNEQMSNQND